MPELVDAKLSEPRVNIKGHGTPVVGAWSNHIVQHKETPEGSITIAHKRFSPIADTIGHVLAIPTVHTILWTWSSAFRNPSKELAGQLFDRYKDVPWKGDLLVRVGYTSILGDLQRIMARNEDVRGRPWMLKDKIGRAIEFVGKLGIAILILPEMIVSKLFRSDFYNPFSNTANVYHPKMAAGMHEIGHAEFFNQLEPKKRAALLIAHMNPLVSVPFMNSFIEWQASAIAMKRYKNDDERREGLKRLEGAWATYYISDVASIVPLPKPFKKWLDSIISYPASIAGHLMARLYPKKDERFGYIFSGEARRPQKDPVLGDRQVLVGMARPQFNSVRR